MHCLPCISHTVCTNFKVHSDHYRHFLRIPPTTIIVMHTCQEPNMYMYINGKCNLNFSHVLKSITSNWHSLPHSVINCLTFFYKILLMFTIIKRSRKNKKTLMLSTP